MDNIISLCNELNNLFEYQYNLLKPQVLEIINNKVKDIDIIEKYLDMLLNIQTDKGCNLFLRLCNYYYSINKENAQIYIDTYNEIYEENAKLIKKRK